MKIKAKKKRTPTLAKVQSENTGPGKDLKLLIKGNDGPVTVVLKGCTETQRKRGKTVVFNNVRSEKCKVMVNGVSTTFSGKKETVACRFSDGSSVISCR